MEISMNTRQAYSEIDTFLNLLSEEKRNEIPKKLRDLFKEIKEQNLKEETLSIIALLNLQYWSKDEEEKQRLKNIYAENEQKYQEELRKKYNPDDIFKKNTSAITENNETDEKTQNTQMIEYKENMFKKILNKISNIFKKKNYEDKLLKEFGKADKYENHNLRILFIADTHNCLKDGNETLKYIQEQEEYDFCILLGDHSGSDIEEILKVIPINKICGILGNHDSWELYNQYGIKNIDGKFFDLGEIRIAGIGGSCKYKNSEEYVQYTQEQSIAIADTLSKDIYNKTHILISHDKAFTEDNHNVAHDGLKGITKYIYENHIGLHIHGHIHENSEQILKNGTRSICVYMAKIIEV